MALPSWASCPRCCPPGLPDGDINSKDRPWEFVALLPLFNPPRHDNAETIDRALHLAVSVKMITGDQLAIAKETGRRLGMGTNMYPSSTLLEENKRMGSYDLPHIDELIQTADGFTGLFPGNCFLQPPSFLIEYKSILNPQPSA